jgi:acid phosphatase type 7
MLNTPVAVLIVLIGVVAVNGVLFFRHHPARTPSPAPVVVAAGDIAACYSKGDEATAELLVDIEGTVLTLGDNVYPDGTAANFEECYEPSWGEFEGRTEPVPGNHEYHTEGAAEYFDYFGEAAGDPGRGYYSYDLGSWHLVALNSNCGEIGGCDASSPQVRWLKEDLAANEEEACTLAYFHHPLFASGNYRPGVDEVKPLWDALHAANADVVLNGHDHNYERFAPQDPEGRADPERGIREFVVGTGGDSLYEIESPVKNLEVYNDDAFGVLQLTLRPSKYDWEFVPVAGKSFTDSGSQSCH